MFFLEPSMTLEEHVEKYAGACHVEVTYTDNTRTMISFKRVGDKATLRAHHMFRGAPDEVAEAVARSYLTRVRKATGRALGKTVRDFIEANGDKVRTKATRHTKRRRYGCVGDTFNLREIADLVNREYFRGDLEVDLTWSRTPNKRYMGTWRETSDGQPNLITINRLLDDPAVPSYYLEYLVYHEMLHEAMPGKRHNGRTLRHCNEYRALERQHTYYHEATKWGEDNLDRLYRKHLRRQRASAGR